MPLNFVYLSKPNACQLQKQETHVETSIEMPISRALDQTTTTYYSVASKPQPIQLLMRENLIFVHAVEPVGAIKRLVRLWPSWNHLAPHLRIVSGMVPWRFPIDALVSELRVGGVRLSGSVIVNPADVVIAAKVSDPFQVPDLPLAVLENKVRGVFSPDPIGTHGGVTFCMLGRARVGMVLVEGLETRRHPKCLRCLAIFSHLDRRGGQGVHEKVARLLNGVVCQDSLEGEVDRFFAYKNASVGYVEACFRVIRKQILHEREVVWKVDVLVFGHKILNLLSGLGTEQFFLELLKPAHERRGVHHSVRFLQDALIVSMKLGLS